MGDWDWYQGFGLGIRIWDCGLGLRLGFGLVIGIGDWEFGLGFEIGD